MPPWHIYAGRRVAELPPDNLLPALSSVREHMIAPRHALEPGGIYAVRSGNSPVVNVFVCGSLGQLRYVVRRLC